MNTATNEDTDALIKKYKQARKKQIERLKDTDDINEGLEPQDIDFIERPWGDQPIDSVLNHIDNNSELLKQYSKEFSLKTPSWLDVWFAIKKEKGNEQLLTKYRVDQEKLGDQIIRKKHLISFSGLKGGAVYHPSVGSWKIFTDNEEVIFVESELAKILKTWGVYDNSTVILTRKYIERMMFRPEVHKNLFDNSNPALVVFKNGTFNFDTGEMQENNPDDYILNGHDYSLDTHDTATPETDRLLIDMMGDATQFFEEFIGYGFYRSYRPFQTALFLHGNGGEGKSGFISYITQYIFEEGNYSSVSPEELTGSQNRFKPAQMYGKEINAVADIDKGYLSNTAILKRLTGGDIVDGEYKMMRNFEFINYAKMLFSANDLPTFSDDSDGFKDRLVVINFINGDTRNDNNDFWKKHDMDKVKQERNSFVYKCIKAFMIAKKRNSFSITPQMKLARDEWFKSNDHFGQFIEETCEIEINSNCGDSAKNVIAEYKAFCQENNYSDKTTSQTITKKLKKIGVERRRSTKGFNSNSNVWRFIGLRLTKSYIDPMYVP